MSSQSQMKMSSVEKKDFSLLFGEDKSPVGRQSVVDESHILLRWPHERSSADLLDDDGFVIVAPVEPTGRLIESLIDQSAASCSVNEARP